MKPTIRPVPKARDYSVSEFARLHAQANRAVRGFITDQLATEQISMPELALMGCLRQARLPVSAAARILAVDRPFATRLVNGLARRGLVRKLPDPSDRRVKVISLTADGRRRLAAMERRLGTALPSLMGPVTPQEYLTYLRVLDHIARQT